jgi:hypothetical protein
MGHPGGSAGGLFVDQVRSVGDHRHACRKRFPDRGRCSRSEARPPNYVMSRAHQSAWDPQRHLRGRRQADERPTTVGILVPDRITRLPREPAGPVGIMPLTSVSRTSFAPCQQAYCHQHFGEQTNRRDRRRLRGILRYRVALLLPGTCCNWPLPCQRSHPPVPNCQEIVQKCQARRM